MAIATQCGAQADADDSRTLLLTCYRDIKHYGWLHVDLFMHDRNGREVNWVHWGAAEEGPDGADAACARVEPMLRRTTDWQHGIRADGSDFWTATAVWTEHTDNQQETTS